MHTNITKLHLCKIKGKVPEVNADDWNVIGAFILWAIHFAFYLLTVLMVSCSLASMKTSISHVATAPEHHTQYVVRVADSHNETTAWFLYKRYSEFRTLRDALQQVNLCTSCRRSTLECIQQFPRRHFFSSTSERVLDERKVRLHHFLANITTASQQCTDSKCVSRSVLEDFLDVPSVQKSPIRLFSAAALPAVDKLGEPLSLLEFNRRERPVRLQKLQYQRLQAHSIG